VGLHTAGIWLWGILAGFAVVVRPFPLPAMHPVSGQSGSGARLTVWTVLTDSMSAGMSLEKVNARGERLRRSAYSLHSILSFVSSLFRFRVYISPAFVLLASFHASHPSIVMANSKLQDEQYNWRNFWICFIVSLGQIAFGYPASVIGVT
jgi:hypothetical protein